MKTIALELVTCNLCGGDDTEEVFFHYDSHFVRCRKCSLVYVNPQHSRARLKEIYDQEYFQRAGQRPYYKNYYADRQWRSREFAKLIAKIGKLKKPKGKLLDVGAAAGFLLDTARKAGWETYGVEISQTASDFARKELGLNLQTGELLEVNFSDETLDVITMVDVIEHMKDPKANLEKAARILKTGGLLVISTPNIGSLGFKIFGKGFVFIGPEHLWYFDVKTLSKMLSLFKLKVIKIEYPYFGTPYFNPKEIWNLAFRTIQKIQKMIVGRREIVPVSSAPMYGNLMQLFCVKES